jgi:hypothetical protein
MQYGIITPHAKKVDYFHEFEAEFKQASARDLGAQEGLFDDKKPKVENPFKSPFKTGF